MSEKKESTKKPLPPTAKIDTEQIRQRSDYRDNGKASPDNNPFFEERSNPLSSKGN